ncbi:MAG: surface protein [Flavipsychrobacter sp.]|jgi:uncharacterized protein YjdB|nr:surface protein [Flavipsychrobacter sp.]
MKKLYFFALLCCLSIKALSQTTVVLWSNSGTTFKTGFATTTARTDGDLQTNGTNWRGWAVFDLASIPVGAAITDVRIGFWAVTILGPAGPPAVSNTTGFVGDLSTVLPGGGVLYNNMLPPFSTILTTELYPSIGPVNMVLASTAASTSFIGANAGGLVSIGLTGGNPKTYVFRGRGGFSAGDADTSTAMHAPFLKITYCMPPTAVSAVASPNPVCDGSTLTLTGSGGTGATNYLWEGPGGYTSTMLSPTLTADPTSAGVYTLTAINACGTFSATAVNTTAAVTVNAAPTAITGAAALCEGLATSLGSTPGAGNWTSSDASVASVGLTTGVVSAGIAGTATITYTISTGCFVTHSMTVNATPDVIAGPTEVCENATITLTNTVTGGTWSSPSPEISVGATTGIITGVTAGTATVTYTTGGCPPVTYDLTVNPAPAPIGGLSEVCVGSTISLTDATSGGTWSSGAITIAMVGGTGAVTGVSAGTVNIIYTLTSTTGCQAFKSVTVNPLPAPIGGPSGVCLGQNITLTDATPGGDFTSTSPNVSVTLGGVVSGLSLGTATVTYTLASTGCAVTTVVTVHPLPSAITGTPEFCEGASVTLSAPDPGGTWTSAFTGTATVGTSSGVVTGVAGGMVDISYTLSTGCSAVYNVTVNPAPIAIITPAGITTFCAGGSVVLDATPGGVTYQWDNGTGPIAGATDASYTASATGSYTVEISNIFGCTATSPAVVVTAGINTEILYSTALNFCIGGNIVLTADAGGAVGAISYQWMKDGTNISGAVFVTHTATVTGVYTASVTVVGASGACTVVTPPVSVVVNNMPVPVISHTGTSLTTASTYAVYQWFINSSAITGATNRTYVPYANGIYRVRVSDAIGCSGYSNAIQITGVGIAQLAKDAVKVYPNPAADVVYIESPLPLRAVITGIEGKVIADNKNAQKLDISKLASGIYILKLYDEQGEMVLVQKLIKE